MRYAKFNKVIVGELEINCLQEPAKINARAAFANTNTGITHGWTTCNSWSKETMEAFKNFKECMERDLETNHFADSSGESPIDTDRVFTTKEEGINEMLKDDIGRQSLWHP